VKVLVTGAAGFIGSHLCPELEKGYEVVPIDRVNGDLRRQSVVDNLLDLHRPDVVVHLAAKVGRLFGEDSPALTVLDNAGMTALVAKSCGERRIRLVYASTSEVYGDGAESTWEETAVMNLPHNLYGLSKRWGEEVCHLYAPEGLVILRFSMPYGPGLPAGRGRAALVNFLHQAMNREPLTVHKDSERSWCWIGDTVRGVRMILESGESGAWNVGRDDNACPMRSVAEMACDLVAAPHSLIQEVDAPSRQTVVKRLSTAKLRSLGWKPEVELPEGMRRTLEELQSLDEKAA
jgi:nucleoside-diphosphate-sugar epimerase